MALSFKKQLVSSVEALTNTVNEIQDEILNVIQSLNSNKLIGSVFFESVQISTTPALVRHSLGFEPNGWLAVNKTASFDIYEDTAASNPDRTQFIALRTSAGSYTLNLIIF